MSITKVNFTSQTAWETQKQINNNFSELDVNKADNSDLPTKTSQLTNDGDGSSKFATESYVNENGGKIDDIKVNGNSQTITNKSVNIIVPVKASDVGALPNTTKYASSISMNIDSTTYIVTAQLKDQEGNNLGTAQTIDLPLESVVVSGSYDNTTKKVVLTLKDGSTVEFSVADLVSGLQTEITSSNKLSADLVKDGTTNKVFTATEKTKLSGIETGAEVNVQSDWNQSNSTADDYIKNKPVIPDNDDFTLSGLSEKSYNSLTDKPTIPDMPVELSFTNSDSRWSSLDSDGFYTLKITSSKTPDNVFKTDNSKKKQVLAGLDYDGTYIYVVTDTKFSGIVTAH